MVTRFRVFFLHFSSSVLISLLTLWVVFYVWYPAPLHDALGVTRIFLLLLLVDMVLGPLLTLLVYKKGKKTLVLDLAVIACLQLSALAYGLSTVAEGRPAWIAFGGDRFELIQVLDIDTRQLDRALQQYRGAPWFGPQWVGAVMPENVEEHNALLFESVGGGSSLVQRPNLYRPLSEMTDSLRQASRSLDVLGNYNDADAVHEALGRWPRADAWLPLMARSKPMVVLLSKARAEVVAVVDLKPWK